MILRSTMHLDEQTIARHVTAALEEDLGGRGDVTSEAVVPAAARARARIVAKEPGVLAGIDLARATFRHLDGTCAFPHALADGTAFAAGDVVLRIEGTARALLAGERTALNFLQRLCGIATKTRAFADAVRGTGAAILETRKTTPGLRYLEKYAVRVGGGTNHRFGLFDAMLLKENHFALSGNGTDAAGYRKTVTKARAAAAGPITAEVRDLAEAEAAFAGGADVLLLDNMSADQMCDVVARIRELSRSEQRQVLLEASGGITLERAASVAAAGVDRISVGALTHSVEVVDLSMLVESLGSGPAARAGGERA